MTAINNNSGQPLQANSQANLPLIANSGKPQNNAFPIKRLCVDALIHTEKFLTPTDLANLNSAERTFIKPSQNDIVWKEIATRMQIGLKSEPSNKSQQNTNKQPTVPDGKQTKLHLNQNNIKQQLITTQRQINEQAIKVVPKNEATRISAINDPFVIREEIAKIIESYKSADCTPSISPSKKTQETPFGNFDYKIANQMLRFKKNLDDIDIQTVKFLLDNGILKPVFVKENYYKLGFLLSLFCGNSCSCEPDSAHPEILKMILDEVNKLSKTHGAIPTYGITNIFRTAVLDYWRGSEKIRKCLNILLEHGFRPEKDGIISILRTFFMDSPVNEQQTLQAVLKVTKGLNKAELLQEIATYENLMPSIILFKRGLAITDLIIKHLESKGQEEQKNSFYSRLHTFITHVFLFREFYPHVQNPMVSRWENKIHAVFDHHPDDETLRNAIKTAFGLSDEESGAILNQAGTVEKHTQETQIGYEKIKQLVNALPEPVQDAPPADNVN